MFFAAEQLDNVLMLIMYLQSILTVRCALLPPSSYANRLPSRWCTLPQWAEFHLVRLHSLHFHFNLLSLPLHL